MTVFAACDHERASKCLIKCDYNLKAAIISQVYSCDKATSEHLLAESNGKLRDALQTAKSQGRFMDKVDKERFLIKTFAAQ